MTRGALLEQGVQVREGGRACGGRVDELDLVVHEVERGSEKGAEGLGVNGLACVRRVNEGSVPRGVSRSLSLQF